MEEPEIRPIGEFFVGDIVRVKFGEYKDSIGEVTEIIKISKRNKYKVAFPGGPEIFFPESLWLEPGGQPSSSTAVTTTSTNQQVPMTNTKKRKKEKQMILPDKINENSDSDDEDPHATEVAEDQAAKDEEIYYEKIDEIKETTNNNIQPVIQTTAKRKKTPPENENPLKPHGREWKVIESDSVSDDVAKEEHAFSIKWSNYLPALQEKRDVKDLLDYFFLCFPLPYLRNIVQGMQMKQQEARDKNSQTEGNKAFYEISNDRIYIFFGIIISMSLNPLCGGVKSYFSSHENDDNTNIPVDFSTKYGMSYHEFCDIKEYLCLNEDGSIEKDGVILYILSNDFFPKIIYYFY